MPNVSYYHILEFQQPYHPLADDTIIVFDLPEGRLEVRHKGDHVLVSHVQRGSLKRLTVEPVVANELIVRVESPPQREE